VNGGGGGTMAGWVAIKEETVFRKKGKNHFGEVLEWGEKHIL